MKKYSFVILWLLLLAACSTQRSEKISQPPFTPVQPIPTITTPSQASPTSGLSKTATREPVSTLVARIQATKTELARIIALTPSRTPTLTATQTTTRTHTPTWTPVPTISLETKKENIQRLFLTNGNCDYPCWWGIQKGASLQDVLELALLLGESPHVYKSQYTYSISLDLEKPGGFLDVIFSEKDKFVQSINVSVSYPSLSPDYQDVLDNALSLSSILNKYGKPDDVLFLVEPKAERDSPVIYALFLVYKTQGFGIEYDGLVDVEGPVVQVCSIKLNDDHLHAINLYLQDPIDKINGQNQSYLNDFQPLESFTSMSLDDFVEAFSSRENDACIETSFDHWK